MNDLLKLISVGENEGLEFKESLRLKEEIGQAVSAFSNARGGSILVGVLNDEKVIGVDIGRNTLEELHESIPRNPAIAKQFFWIKYIEEVGTGTNKIIEWCTDWGLPEPEFEFTGTSLVVTFRKSELTDEYLEQLGLNKRQKKAITYLKEEGKIDRRTYCNICGVGKTVAHEELADMVDKELIEMVGRGRGVCYMLRMKRTISGQLADN